MLAASRRAVGTALAGLRRLMGQPDALLLLGREGRWRWPWVVAGLAAIWLLFSLLSRAPRSFEDLALQQGWIGSRFSRAVFPFDPSRPLSYLYDLLCWLPYILPPLIVLRMVHGVSWRRAFSYGTGFRWRQFWQATMALLIVLGLGAALAHFFEPQQHLSRAPGLGMAPWIALASAAIFVQTLGEDVLYFGYLLRTWGAVLAFPLPVAGAVIALFISNHLGNEDIQRDPVLVVTDLVIMTAISIAMLYRTQNLAAAAGLHWINNVFILLWPAAPEEVGPLALVVYTDPVYAVGGSYLLNPAALAAKIAGPAVLLVLLLWRGSPFYLAKAPSPVSADSHRTPAADNAGAGA